MEENKSLGKAGFHCSDRLELRIKSHRWVILPTVDTQRPHSCQGAVPKTRWGGGMAESPREASVDSSTHSSCSRPRSLLLGSGWQWDTSRNWPLCPPIPVLQQGGRGPRGQILWEIGHLITQLHTVLTGRRY